MATQGERIAKGIALLDEERPDWCDSIDLVTLDLGSPFYCVLGQVFEEEGEKTGDSGFECGIVALDVEYAPHFGFDRPYRLDDRVSSSTTYEHLTTAWKKAIREHCPNVS